MIETFHRDRVTWLAYLLLAFYSFFLNSLGPITPFLKDELSLSYTVSGLHFTAFAAGMLMIGLIGNAVIRRLGQVRGLWLGAFGISVSVALLVAVRSVVVTIGAAFCMGLVGSLILIAVPSLLSDRHGVWRPVALFEANMTASLVGIAAPLLVGWAAYLTGNWRWALGLVALAPLLGRWLFGRRGSRGSASSPTDPTTPHERLSLQYWVYWVALFLAVSVEFCMVFWSANYLVGLGMEKADAAQAVALLLGGMVVGRYAGSRLIRRLSSHAILFTSIVTAGLGFGIFWGPQSSVSALIGLFVTGLGIASLYPLILSLAIGAAPNSVRASARATLASATAILMLPLVLGRVADATGLRWAYGVVGFLLAGILMVVLLTRPVARPRYPGST